MSNAGTLAGLRIGITRERSQAETTAQLVARRGGVARLFPLLSFAPCASASDVEAALANLASGDVVALTSANGVRYAVACAADALRLAQHRGIRLAAVGDVTARELRAAGLHVDVVATEQDGAGLARALLGAGVAAARALILRAKAGLRTLESALQEAGWSVQVLDIYETRIQSATPLWQALMNDELDVLLFASPSAIHAFASSADARPLPSGVQLACIGPTTAHAARQAGLAVHIMPEHPSIEAALDLLASHIK